MAKRADNVVLFTDFELKQNFFARYTTLINLNAGSCKIAATRVTSVLDENCRGYESETESDSGIFAIINQNFDVICNIEAWRTR